MEKKIKLGNKLSPTAVVAIDGYLAKFAGGMYEATEKEAESLLKNKNVYVLPEVVEPETPAKFEEAPEDGENTEAVVYPDKISSKITQAGLLALANQYQIIIPDEFKTVADRSAYLLEQFNKLNEAGAE